MLKETSLSHSSRFIWAHRRFTRSSCVFLWFLWVFAPPKKTPSRMDKRENLRIITRTRTHAVQDLFLLASQEFVPVISSGFEHNQEISSGYQRQVYEWMLIFKACSRVPLKKCPVPIFTQATVWFYICSDWTIWKTIGKIMDCVFFFFF